MTTAELKEKIEENLRAIPEGEAREKAAENTIIFLAGCRSMTAAEGKR